MMFTGSTCMQPNNPARTPFSRRRKTSIIYPSPEPVNDQLKPTPFNNVYTSLGDDFYARTLPVPVANPGLIIFNHALGDEAGLADTCLAARDCAAIFAGNVVPEGAEPVAMALDSTPWP